MRQVLLFSLFMALSFGAWLIRGSRNASAVILSDRAAACQRQRCSGRTAYAWM